MAPCCSRSSSMFLDITRRSRSSWRASIRLWCSAAFSRSTRQLYCRRSSSSCSSSLPRWRASRISPSTSPMSVRCRLFWKKVRTCFWETLASRAMRATSAGPGRGSPTYAALSTAHWSVDRRGRLAALSPCWQHAGAPVLRSRHCTTAPLVEESRTARSSSRRPTMRISSEANARACMARRQRSSGRLARSSPLGRSPRLLHRLRQRFRLRLRCRLTWPR
mmetsp:Transcript_32639/g.91394  ORF Transcript_32639/g.91394 Transcript_32639/m.91394 type:complete len:220 (-) Transcript_32639:291-950(-)